MSGMGSAISVAQLCAIVWRWKVVAALAFCIAASSAFSIIKLVPKRFDASALLLIGEKPKSGLAGVGASDTDEAVASLSAIALTDDVLRNAVKRVGVEYLLPKAASADTALETAPLAQDPKTSGSGTIQSVIALVRSALVVKPEAKTNLLRVTFSSKKPEMAAAVANAVAQSILDRQAELMTRPDLVRFFEDQRRRYEDEIRQASAHLATYVAENGTYAVDEQRKLLMARASTIEAALLATRGSIADLRGRETAVTEQLKRLASYAQSPPVADIAAALEERERQLIMPMDRAVTPGGDTPADAPLSIVKLYQEKLTEVLKDESDIAGLTKMESSQVAEVAELKDDLLSLAAKGNEFLHLSRLVDAASSNMERLEKRIEDERLDADLGAAKLSRVQMVQAATVPLKAAFPNTAMIAVGAVIGGLTIALGSALVAEWLAGTATGLTKSGSRMRGDKVPLQRTTGESEQRQGYAPTRT